MSISAITTGNYAANGTQSANQSRRVEFQQLGKDLQSGNLTAAEQDFTTLSQNSTTAAGSQSSAASQLFANLGDALKNGDLTGAQKAYATIQQATQLHGHHHHHHASQSTGATDPNAANAGTSGDPNAVGATATSGLAQGLSSAIGVLSLLA